LLRTALVDGIRRGPKRKHLQDKRLTVHKDSIMRTPLSAVTVIALATALAQSPLAVGADDTASPRAAPAAPAGPGILEVLTNSGIVVTGYVDAAYEYSNSPAPAFHEFDTRHSSFVLDQASVTLAMQPKSGFGFVVDLIAGEDSRVINAAESSNAASGASNFNVTQAFVQYVTGNWTLLGGKFVTLVGAEVIAATGNTNFSRSLLFFAEPLTHTGVRAAYAVNDELTFTVGVNNGWNHLSNDTQSQKTTEVGVSFTPVKQFILTAQGYIGDEPVGGGQVAQRDIADVVATYNVNDSLSLVVNYDCGRQKNYDLLGNNGKWDGVAGYVNYAINSQWRVSVRGEYFQDRQGFVTTTGTRQTLREGTVTLGFDPIKKFELRLEARYDKADHDLFLRDSTDLADNQTGLALQTVYKF
jgi:hypothetical protein